MTDVEFEEDTSEELERPLLANKENFDLELGLALSKSLYSSDTTVADNKQIMNFFNLQIDLLLKFCKK